MQVITSPRPAPRLWAGVECTVNRVGDSFFDQVSLTGHDVRPTDIDRLATLGVSAIRYPILWERTAPDGLDEIDWSWPDERMARLRQVGVRPIVGLVHHGSGPRHTNLLEPDFADKLAAYAGAVARRYPFALDWTPINEVVTTARFAALYGIWFPHRRSSAAFVRAVLNQCRGVVLSMQAIRAEVPGARLVHTEDAGQISATPALAYQAEYENQRQRLAIDLLVGRVAPGHPWWDHLLASGATARELFWFQEHACPPDVIGLNYYLTSDRFLDDALEQYPPHVIGGNGRHAYADVESVRVWQSRITGHDQILRSFWDRYRRPLALTEVHLGSTSPEQIRWFAEAWFAALRACGRGIAVEAVTSWASLGVFGWDQLVTSTNGTYEPGLYDVRGEQPVLTSLGRAVGRLGQRGTLEHPALQAPGWWRRWSRCLYGGVPGGPGPRARPDGDWCQPA